MIALLVGLEAAIQRRHPHSKKRNSLQPEYNVSKNVRTKQVTETMYKVAERSVYVRR